MAINPELEAAIEKDPDDEDAYFVYGDWLQTQGDPRGELIALAAAALRAPGDKKAAQRVDKHFKQHAGELLGGVLAEHGIHVSWHLGFVRDVQFGEVAPDQALIALRVLLAHPSGRFVQSIAFLDRPGLDPAAIVKILVEEARPATLADLRIGRGWDTARDAPELKSVFPRLEQSLDAEWRRILGVLAKQRKLDLKYDASKLPALVARPGIEAAGITNDQILLALRLDLDKSKGVGIVPALRRSFTVESLDRFAVALAEQWSARGETTPLRWGFQALGHLGDVLAVGWIAERLGEWSHQRAVQGAQMLGRIKTGAATWELFAMISDPRMMRSRREDAARVLDNVAAERKLGLDRLLDRCVPATASAAVSMPIVRRLEAHMVDGRRIPAGEFMHYFVSHPIVAAHARRVLWATYEGPDALATFRIDDGQALDAAGDVVDLTGAEVGVLHPAELPEDERKTVLKEWAEVFSDEDIEPLFQQLDRPVHELREQDRGTTLTRFKLRTVGFDQLRAVFEVDLDWGPDREDSDGGPITLGWSRAFMRDRVFVSTHVASGAIGSVTVTRTGKKLAFGNLHPVTASEILWAVERATTRPQAEPVDGGAVDRGTRVRIYRGAGRGSEGVVFWLGDGNNGPRCGLRTDDDETVWANLADVRPVEGRAASPSAGRKAKEEEVAAKPPAKKTKKRPVVDDDDDDDGDQDAGDGAPEIAKGMKVRWSKGRHLGTGVAFWIGKNKFGDGMRVGVKDDETGETVWCDLADCKPAE